MLDAFVMHALNTLCMQNVDLQHTSLCYLKKCMLGMRKGNFHIVTGVTRIHQLFRKDLLRKKGSPPPLLLYPHSCAYADVIPTPSPFALAWDRSTEGHLRDEGH